MRKITIDLPEISNDTKHDLMEILPYILNDILKIEVQESKFIISTLSDKKEIEFKKNILNWAKKLEDLNRKTPRHIDLEIKKYDFTSENKTSIWEELIKGKIIVEVAEGSYVYRKIFKKIYEFSNSNFKNIEYIKSPVLQNIKGNYEEDYIKNYPQHIYYCCKPKITINNIEELDKLKNINSCYNLMDNPSFILTHAACSWLYPTLTEDDIKDKNLNTFLLEGRCFRNEEKKLKELLRLNEFNMLEIVFWGRRSYIEEAVVKIHKFWDNLVYTFKLDAKINRATDSFVGTTAALMKAYQLLNGTKEELVMNLPEENYYYPVSSINLHRKHFVKMYNIELYPDYETACMDFGLDRIVYLFLSQKGLDVQKWDKETYNEINKYERIDD